MAPAANMEMTTVRKAGVQAQDYTPAYNRAQVRGRDDLMGDFDRITHDPQVMGGKPTIRGMRVTVGMVVGLIGAGRTIDQVLADYPYLEREDVLQALRYAAWRAEDRELTLSGE